MDGFCWDENMLYKNIQISNFWKKFVKLTNFTKRFLNLSIVHFLGFLPTLNTNFVVYIKPQTKILKNHKKYA